LSQIAAAMHRDDKKQAAPNSSAGVMMSSYKPPSSMPTKLENPEKVSREKSFCVAKVEPLRNANNI
jgi:hypothetical protein